MSGFFLAGCIMRILGILVVLCIVRITQHLSSFEEKLPPPPLDRLFSYIYFGWLFKIQMFQLFGF